MNKEEFIGKLEMVYVGDRNAFNEIVDVYDELKGDNKHLNDLLDGALKEYDRLNNIIKNKDRKIKFAIKIFEHINKIYGESSSINDVIDVLKEDNNGK